MAGGGSDGADATGRGATAGVAWVRAAVAGGEGDGVLDGAADATMNGEDRSAAASGVVPSEAMIIVGVRG